MASVSELNYKSVPNVSPQYAYQRVVALGSSTSISLDTSNYLVTFPISVGEKCINLSRSVLQYKMTFGAGAAGYYNRLFTNILPFDSLVLRTASGVELQRISYADRASHILNRTDRKLEDVRCYTSLVDNNSTVMSSSGLELFNGLQSANYDPYNTTSYGKNYSEMTVGIQSSSTTNVATPVDTFNLKLDLPNSLFAVDKDIPVSEQLYFDVTWAGLSGGRVGVKGTAATNWTTGLLALTGGITISNLSLQLAVEQDPQINAHIFAQVRSSGGLRVLYDNPVCIQTITGASTQQQQSVVVSSGNGNRLKRVYYSMFNPASNLYYERSQTAYFSAEKLSSYQMFFNNQPLTNNLLLFSDGTAYQVMQDKLVGSCVSDGTSWIKNFVYCHSFDDINRLVDKFPNELRGHDLQGRDGVLQFVGTDPNGVTAWLHFVILVHQRTLVITNNRMEFSNA